MQWPLRCVLPLHMITAAFIHSPSLKSKVLFAIKAAADHVLILSLFSETNAGVGKAYRLYHSPDLTSAA